jgi:phage terminase large subunit-like protein
MKKYNDNNVPLWHKIARKEQRIPKGDWWLWMLLAGRGFGKTRTGAESVMEMINSGQYKRIAIIWKTIQEAKDIMVEGQTGLLSTTIADVHFQNENNEDSEENNKDILKFKYYSSRNQIIWENGAKAYIIGADNYEKLRGYQFVI